MWIDQKNEENYVLLPQSEPDHTVPVVRTLKHGLAIVQKQSLPSFPVTFWPLTNDWKLNVKPQGDDHLVFPNPLPRNEPLRIFSRAFAADECIRMDLYNVHGKPVFSEILLSDREEIELSALRAGVYFYVLTSDTGMVRGKVILR